MLLSFCAKVLKDWLNDYQITVEIHTLLCLYFVIRGMKKRGYSMDKEMMKGNIDLILLSLIAKEDLYGYEMTKKVALN